MAFSHFSLSLHVSSKTFLDDENINWNEPMILYNEDGTVLFDPSDPDRFEKDIDDMSDPGDEGDVDINVPINIEEKEEDTSGGSS